MDGFRSAIMMNREQTNSESETLMPSERAEAVTQTAQANWEGGALKDLIFEESADEVANLRSKLEAIDSGLDLHKDGHVAESRQAKESKAALFSLTRIFEKELEEFKIKLDSTKREALKSLAKSESLRVASLAEIDRLKNSEGHYKAQLGSLKAELEQKSTRLQQMDLTLSSLTQMVADQTQALEDHRTALAFQKNTSEELKVAVLAHETAWHEQKAQLSAKQAELTALHADYQNQLMHLRNLGGASEQKSTRIAALVEDLRAENAELRVSLNLNRTEIENEREKSSHLLSALEMERQQRTNALRPLEEREALAQFKQEESSRVIGLLQANLREQGYEVDRLKANHDRLAKENESLRSQASEKEGHFARAEAESAGLRKKVASSEMLRRTERERAERALAESRREHERALTQERSIREESKASFEIKIKVLKQELKEQTEKVDQLSVREADLVKAKDATETKFFQLEKLHQALKAHADRQEGEIKRLATEQNSAWVEVKRLEAESRQQKKELGARLDALTESKAILLAETTRLGVREAELVKAGDLSGHRVRELEYRCQRQEVELKKFETLEAVVQRELSVAERKVQKLTLELEEKEKLLTKAREAVTDMRSLYQEKSNEAVLAEASDHARVQAQRELEKLEQRLEHREARLRHYATSLSREKSDVLSQTERLISEISAAQAMNPLQDYLQITEHELSKVEKQMISTSTLSPERANLESYAKKLIEQRDFLRSIVGSAQKQLDERTQALRKIVDQITHSPVPPVPPRLNHGEAN